MSKFNVSNFIQNKNYPEIYHFTIQDESHAYINSLRRILCEHIPVYAASKVKIIRNESSIKDEQLAKSLKLIRFRQILNGVKIDYSQIRFEINVTATEDIKLVTSSDLKLYYKNSKNQINRNHFIPNIYLCALDKGKTLELIGQFEKNIEMKDGAFSCVARVGYEEITTPSSNNIGKYQFNIHILETFTFKELIIAACNVFNDLLDSFAKDIELHIKNNTNKPNLNYETSQFDDTILNVVIDAIHSLYGENIEFAAYNRHHILTDNFTFLINAKNYEKIIFESIKHIKEKNNKLLSIVNSK